MSKLSRNSSFPVEEFDPIELRCKLGWSLEELAEQMGFSVSVTLKWSNKNRNPGKQAKKQAYKIALEKGLII